ncbi:hypothetical protein EMIHUDRAFT_222070 [Emiliania huxleyi CCMP1516]|uniref:N-sulphoglucosamine sulphohydrolase C-terminal domain-containing protein n=2 Tax=Emiliania huxleyi TaxID=2903 RepID=A0A0D3KZ36_EMIH1|nr:hypothetical protein EMIHUDRAFT_222070 [Emiliania huxleyi CCMP1516]EOD41021.1 hypothetical protein EMIHUDRAFT_222070 [Emiliania huxleyi CCMP1516]|eukprot:XP_005793450.1 hypothetical protein EMIHUDRAFT_222070 [Emiliania huxleyi CCMP1516]
MYETDLHVPMMIKAPGYSPARVPAMVENIDLYPTILDLIGVPAPSHVQGTSLYLDSDTIRYEDEQFSEYCSHTCWTIDTCRQSCRENLNRADDPSYSRKVTQMRSDLQAHKKSRGSPGYGFTTYWSRWLAASSAFLPEPRANELSLLHTSVDVLVVCVDNVSDPDNTGLPRYICSCS